MPYRVTLTLEEACGCSQGVWTKRFAYDTLQPLGECPRLTRLLVDTHSDFNLGPFLWPGHSQTELDGQVPDVVPLGERRGKLAKLGCVRTTWLRLEITHESMGIDCGHYHRLVHESQP